MFNFLPPQFTPFNSSENLKQFLSPAGVMFFVMDRPEVHNAFDEKLIDEMTQALLECEENPEVKVLVLTGAGKNFSAGGDINYMREIGQKNFEENKKDALALAELMHTLNEFPKPTIARVNGAAFGGGVGLVCACDMAFGTPSTKICLSEVKIGMVPATIGPYVIKAIGPRNAHRLMLTAEIMQGQKAVNCGFLADVFDQENFDKSVNKIAEKISNNGPEALQITKAILHNLTHQPLNEGVIDYTAEVIAQVRSSEEGKEGLSAFLEKRKPKF